MLRSESTEPDLDYDPDRERRRRRRRTITKLIRSLENADNHLP
jgi:hypothetical protein